MGSRANVFVRDEQGEALYYAHWGGQSMPAKLFWGPEVALAYARDLPQREIHGEWLDDVWSEGGMAMDCVARRLVWYGGEDIQYDARLRKLYLALQAVSWPGWEIQWAADGVLDLARLAGVRREQVMPWDGPIRGAEPNLEEFEGETDTCVVLIDGEGQWKVHCSGSDFLDAWPNTLQWVDLMERATLPTSRTIATPMSGGILIDKPAWRVSIFYAGVLEDARRRLLRPWAGWEHQWLGDDEGAFAALTRGHVQRPPQCESSQLEQLQEIVSVQGSGPELLRRVASLMADEGRARIQVNPNALTPDPQLTIDTDRLFADVVRRWRMQREERFDI